MSSLNVSAVCSIAGYPSVVSTAVVTLPMDCCDLIYLCYLGRKGQHTRPDGRSTSTAPTVFVPRSDKNSCVKTAALLSAPPPPRRVNLFIYMKLHPSQV